MANPLQPKCIKVLEQDYNAYVIKITSASKAGHMDIIACIKGLFYGFEIKWKSDVPSELQKDKINKVIDAGGKAYFIHSTKQLKDIMDNDIAPFKYELSNRFII